MGAQTRSPPPTHKHTHTRGEGCCGVVRWRLGGTVEVLTY